MRRDLDGRVAVVTGAARNIGRAIALELAAAGARLVVNARGSAEAAAEVAARITQEGGEAEVILADVGDPAGAGDLVARSIARFGRLDILVNNAALRRETAFEALEWTEWREVFAATLDSAYLCARAALPHLRAAGGGSIVNLGGMSAHRGSSGRAHVIAAKAGVVGLTRALAHDLGPDNITVNCVVPGLIDTERGESAKGTPEHHRTGSLTLLGRRGHPEEVAAAVRYLCGPSARYVTGQCLHVNGGAYLP